MWPFGHTDPRPRFDACDRDRIDAFVRVVDDFVSGDVGAECAPKVDPVRVRGDDGVGDVERAPVGQRTTHEEAGTRVVREHAVVDDDLVDHEIGGDRQSMAAVIGDRSIAYRDVPDRGVRAKVEPISPVVPERVRREIGSGDAPRPDRDAIAAVSDDAIVGDDPVADRVVGERRPPPPVVTEHVIG